MPKNGDINPYGLVVIPSSIPPLTAGNASPPLTVRSDGNLVETTPSGSQVAVKMLDTSPAPPGPNGNGTLFGVEVNAAKSGVLFVDNGTNTLNILQ